jgi:hypothetical protein
VGQAAVLSANDGASIEPSPPELIQRLEERARADELTGAELSRRLGVNNAQWWRVRKGVERFGPAVIARIVELYPELQDAAVLYLTSRFDGPTLRLLAEASRVVEEAETTDARPGPLDSGEPTG